MARSGVRVCVTVTDKPPAIARVLVSLASPESEREAVIGDLEEEFRTLAATSPRGADRWYWRQAIISAPRFCADRARRTNALQFCLLVAITFIGYVGITFWDIEVARRAARGAAGVFSNAPLIITRGFYIFVQAFGFAGAGAAIAYVTFRSDKSFMQNTAIRLTPFAMLAFAQPLALSLFTENGYPLSFRLPWFAMTATALLMGAWVGVRLPRK